MMAANNNCRYVHLCQVGARHKDLIKKGETDNAVIAKHTEALSIVLQALWLRRSAETSTFFGAALTSVLKNKHQAIGCRLPKEFEDAVNGRTKEIGREITEKHKKAVAKWKRGKKIEDAPSLNINNWLLKARKMRVLSTFPRLSSLGATAD